MIVFWSIWATCWLLIALSPLAKKMILNRPTFGAGRDAMLLKFMRQAGKKLCYEDIRTMELYLYGKSFEHLGANDGYRDGERSTYRHGNHPRDWDKEFRLPVDELEREPVKGERGWRGRKRKRETFTACRYTGTGIEEVEIEL